MFAINADVSSWQKKKSVEWGCVVGVEPDGHWGNWGPFYGRVLSQGPLNVQFSGALLPDHCHGNK